MSIIGYGIPVSSLIISIFFKDIDLRHFEQKSPFEEQIDWISDENGNIIVKPSRKARIEYEAQRIRQGGKNARRQMLLAGGMNAATTAMRK